MHSAKLEMMEKFINKNFDELIVAFIGKVNGKTTINRLLFVRLFHCESLVLHGILTPLYTH